MRIVRSDDQVLELRGRQEHKEQGTAGLWLVVLVGLSFAVASGFWLRDESRYWSSTTLGLSNMASAIIAGGMGIAGLLLLAFGVTLALKRESLRLDLRGRTGVYCRRRLPRAASEILKFNLEQATEVSVHRLVENVAGGDGPTTRHLKWESRLHVAPTMVIRLCRSSSQVKVNQLAGQVRQALGLKPSDAAPASIATATGP